MEENKSNVSDKKLIIGLSLLVLVLVAGVMLIFKGLEAALPDQWDAQIWDNMYTANGGTAVYDLRMLSAEELEAVESKDVRVWLEYAQNELGEDQVFWLCRQDSQEYVLYLPEQDRVLENEDLSATEETMDDGRVTLVLRARTPEQSEEIAPEAQLFCVKSESKDWDGQRMKVILDGREQTVIQCTSKGNQVYSADGAEIK